MAEGLVFPVLIGEGKAVASWVNREKIQAAHIEIIEEPDSAKALALAIDMLKKGAVEILMRGSIEPQRFFETVLDKEKGLLKERVASLVSVFDPPGVERVTMATDTYINSFPSIVEKVTITENVIRLARVLGFRLPEDRRPVGHRAGQPRHPLHPGCGDPLEDGREGAVRRRHPRGSPRYRLCREPQGRHPQGRPQRRHGEG